MFINFVQTSVYQFLTWESCVMPGFTRLPWLQGTTSIPKGCSSMSMSCRANFSCGRQIRWVFPSCGDGQNGSGANTSWILGVFNNNGFLPDVVCLGFFPLQPAKIGGCKKKRIARRGPRVRRASSNTPTASVVRKG